MCWVYDILIHACCGFTYLPIYGQSTVVRCLVVVVGTASYRLRKYLVCLAMTTNTLTHTGCGSHWHACGYYLFIKSTTERRRRQRIDWLTWWLLVTLNVGNVSTTIYIWENMKHLIIITVLASLGGRGTCCWLRSVSQCLLSLWQIDVELKDSQRGIMKLFPLCFMLLELPPATF